MLAVPDPLTRRDFVDIFSAVIGHELPVRFAAPGDPIPLLPEIVPPMLAEMETYDTPIPMLEKARTFGVELTPLTTFVHRRLSPSAQQIGWLHQNNMNKSRIARTRIHIIKLRIWLKDLGDGQTG